ncbi:MAG TPA: LacI family DNA-binding transcriptional regulator, partial [Chitinophagaceae bacterium]
MQKKRFVINDIAKQLNVSVTTVSFIINGKSKEKRISEELTSKVLELVEKVGYVPNQLAKSLRTGKTNIIALIVEDISNVFFATVARLIEEEANAKGYKIIYCSSDNDVYKTRELLKVFRERQVDGYIITPSPGIEEDIAALMADRLPVVLFDRRLAEVATNYVGVDNEQGTYMAIQHLIEQGYKRIAFVTLNTEQSQMQERLNGYKRAIEAHELKPCVKKVQEHHQSERLVEEIVKMLSRKNNLDAVFFATNYLGISGLDALKRMGLRIPGDVAVAT